MDLAFISMRERVASSPAEPRCFVMSASVCSGVG